MRNLVSFSAIALSAFVPVAAVAASAPAPAASPAAAAKPLRHLVYGFTWGSTTDRTTNVSGFVQSGGMGGSMEAGGAASGMAENSGGTQDQGTIAVDVLREQPDKGLVVSISEQARNTRSARPTTCVVYGNTNVICDPNGKINEEEMVLLRYLGTTFVDPSQIDPKNHWQVSQNTPDLSTTTDFTIAHNESGLMTVDMTRVTKGTGAHQYERDATGTLTYNFSRTLPSAVNEQSIERSQRGSEYDVVKTSTVLQLQTDSLASTKTP